MNEREDQVLTDGKPVPADGSHTTDRGDGQQKAYVVLTEAERAKGFVRPVRDAYVHVGVSGSELDLKPPGCGTLTRMTRSIAETYARNPAFYTGTFCVGCGKHLPLAQFVWDGTDQRVGS